MPLTAEQLDDWSYNDLIAEGLALLPAAAPGWTNFNPSDPGITLIELFAYFTEMLVFQTGQITPADRLAFLRLLTGTSPSTGVDVDLATRDALRALRSPERGVTPRDFETLALRADPRVRRAYCVARANLSERNEAAREVDRPGHVSVVLVTDGQRSSVPELTGVVAAYLEPRRVLTTRVHVVMARPVDFQVRLRVVPESGVAPETARANVASALASFFDPILGGFEGKGWPMGRDIFVSDLYRVASVLDTSDRVSRVLDGATGARLEELALPGGSAERLYRNAEGDLIGLRLAPDEIPGTIGLQLEAAAAARVLGEEV